MCIRDSYLLVFVYSLKRFQSFSHSDMRTPDDFLRDDFAEDLCVNPYLILLRRYLEYFSTSENNAPTLIYEKLVFFLEDFLCNEIVYAPTGVVFQKASVLNRNDALQQIGGGSIQMPRPHIFEALYILVHYQHKRLGIFGPDYLVSSASPMSHGGVMGPEYLGGGSASTKSARITLEDRRHRYIFLFYKFFFNSMRLWNKDHNNTYSLLADLGAVWFRFIKPVELYEGSDLIDAIRLIENPGADLTGSTGGAQGAFPRKNSSMNASGGAAPGNLKWREQMQGFSEFIKRNVLLYTHLLSCFLATFADLNEIRSKDILRLRGVLEFFDFQLGENEESSSFIGGNLRIRWLNQIARGRSDPTFDMLRHLEEYGADQQDVYPFDSEIFRGRIAKIIQNLKGFKLNFAKNRFRYDLTKGSTLGQLWWVFIDSLTDTILLMKKIFGFFGIVWILSKLFKLFAWMLRLIWRLFASCLSGVMLSSVVSDLEISGKALSVSCSKFFNRFFRRKMLTHDIHQFDGMCRVLFEHVDCVVGELERSFQTQEAMYSGYSPAGSEYMHSSGRKRGIKHVMQPHIVTWASPCLLYTSPSPRDGLLSRMPSSA
eukprot:TRINITY_DN12891_c0_g1_i1.p1 TRINITY_DN12891_c0_g1~~TRINITY_DN12891_c0_g1_i1.p1  ORF type:complete len:598 (+),score=125.04 TRINITY_DN12891_c0_g1_i1:64-1857(+)